MGKGRNNMNNNNKEMWNKSKQKWNRSNVFLKEKEEPVRNAGQKTATIFLIEGIDTRK